MTDIDPIELEQLQRAFDRLPDLHAAVFSAARHDDMTYADRRADRDHPVACRAHHCRHAAPFAA